MLSARIKKGVLFYFVSAGIVAHIGLAGGAFYLYSTYQLTFRQFLVKATEKAGIDSDALTQVISASSMFPDHQMDGRLKVNYPRILLKNTSKVTPVSFILNERIQRFKEQEINVADPCDTKNIVAQATCWAVTADDNVANKVLKTLKSFQLITPDVQAQYGNVWELALAYDLLASYSGLSDEDRVVIQSKLKKSLTEYIALLDESGPSLWHGRATLASIAWLVAVTLDQNESESAALIKRAQAHFLDVVAAAELTEAWPEGFNYWIQNRAFIFSLAANAYINGLEESENKNRVKHLLERVGLWHIYATRPDNRIEGLGDEGSRVDLKDETQRVIDLIAQATGNPIFAQYSRYISLLHKNEAYYRDYRWGQLLFSDPDIFSLPQTDKSLFNFSSLPKVDVFGKDAFNQFYIRSGWGNKDTFISYRAGHTFTHHGHADAGHFSIFKGTPLAINSSVYGKYTGENRLNYSIRSIAKNSLLILRPGEKVTPNKFFTENVADGGQRIVLPTGSTIDNTADWVSNLNKGNHYEAGKLISFESKENDFTYIKSDLTGAYNNTSFDSGGRGGKVEKVERSLVYLNKSDQLIVYDKVISTDAAYTKKWLLHSVNKPESKNLEVLRGSLSNGILSTKSDYALIKNNESYLHVQRLLPRGAELRLVGGPDYQYYVELDGDDSDLDGRNMSQDASDKPWFDVGMWRMEIQPSVPREQDEFLVVLAPSFNAERKNESELLDVSGNASGLTLGSRSIVFVNDRERLNIEVFKPDGVNELMFFGLPENHLITLSANMKTEKLKTNSEGVLVVTSDKIASNIKLK